MDKEEQELIVKAVAVMEQMREQIAERLRIDNPQPSPHYQHIWMQGFSAGFVRAYVDVIRTSGSVMASRIEAATQPSLN